MSAERWQNARVEYGVAFFRPDDGIPSNPEEFPPITIAVCDFDPCEADATFIEEVEGRVFVWCEVHGQMRGLTRGIPMSSVAHNNTAEPEARCIHCGSAMEFATLYICIDCAQEGPEHEHRV